METIHKGIVTEKELVELYASETVKRSYFEKGHFVSSQKKDLLKKISNYCQIDDLRNRTYEIKNVLSDVQDKKMQKIRKAYYKELVPIILKNFIDNGYDSLHKQQLYLVSQDGALVFAKKLGIVNDNMYFVKYHSNEIASLLNCPIKVVQEFYHFAIQKIQYYLSESVKAIVDLGFFALDEYKMVEIINLENSLHVNDDCKIEFNVKIEETIATDEIIAYYDECVKMVDKRVGTTCPRDRYHSKKSKQFMIELKQELIKKNIKSIYTCFKYYYTERKKVKNFLDSFEIHDYDNCEKFKKDFYASILSKFCSEFNDEKSIELKMSKRQYQSAMTALCGLGLVEDNEYCKKLFPTVSGCSSKKSNPIRFSIERKKN